MTTNAQIINWVPTAESGDYVGSVSCVATTDTNWIVTLQGNVPQSRDAIAIKPRFVLVDNISNGANCTVTFGPFSYSVPRYTRQTYAIPFNQLSVQLSLTTGTVNLTFAPRRDLLTDGADAFAIQQAANSFVNYTWATKTATGSQAAGDQNKNLSLTNAAAQSYNLQGIAAAAIANGWYNPLIRNDGAGRWSITPNGADQINSLYTAALPLKLSTGDWLSLWCDGAAWKASGVISFTTALTPFTNVTATTFTHDLGARPDECLFVNRCVIADIGYAVGDEVVMSPHDDTSGAIGGLTTQLTSTTARSIVSGGTNISAKGTFARSTMTPANWNYYLILRKYL